MGTVSRAFWRWQHKYCQPKRAGIAPFYQVIVGSMIFFYAINYGKISKFYFDKWRPRGNLMDEITFFFSF
jgi:hypothetical protein